MKFQVHWTGTEEWRKKNPNAPIMNLQEFSTRKAAEEFVKKNKYLYWSSITSAYPQSHWPKVLVSSTDDLTGTHNSITGILDTYYETGMEVISIIVDPMKKGAPNKSYDPSKPDSGTNFPFYKDLMDMHFINKNDILQLDNGMRYALIHDRDFAVEDDYRMSIYPAGFSKAEIVALIKSKAKVTVWYARKKLK